MIGVIHDTEALNHTNTVPLLPLVTHSRAVHRARVGHADTTLHLQVVGDPRGKPDRNRCVTFIVPRANPDREGLAWINLRNHGQRCSRGDTGVGATRY